MKNLNVTRKLLYDGVEMNIPERFRIFAASYEIVLAQADLYGNSLRDLEAVVSKEDFERIASHFTIQQFGNIKLYLADDVQVYYARKDQYIVIFSFGETQPGRYEIFLEGVWLKE